MNQSKRTLSNEEVVSAGHPFPLSSSKKGDSKVIEGYALTFGQRSKLLGNFYEIIDPHALDNVDLSDVRCLVDHDYSKVLGRVLSETLQLSVDERGLKFSVEVPNTSYGNDLYESVRRGDINECSFGFVVDPKDTEAQELRRVDNETYLRTVKRIESLKEISIVANPAYESTTAQVQRDAERSIKAFETEKLKLGLELLDF